MPPTEFPGGCWGGLAARSGEVIRSTLMAAAGMTGDSGGAGHPGARGRVDDIRRALAATTDAPARARLRVRLAGLLAQLDDPAPGVAELRQAAAEAPPTAGLLLAVRAIAPRLAAADADSLWEALRAARPARRVTPGPGSNSGSAPASAIGSTTPPTASETANAHRRLPTATARASAPAPVSSATARAASDPNGRPAAPAVAPLAVPVEVPAKPLDVPPIDAAFAALAARKPLRARRLAEEVSRAGDMDSTQHARLAEMVTALEAQGAIKESLRLARTLAEASGNVATPAVPAEAHPTQSAGAAQAVQALVDRAADSGQPELALRWSADLAGRPASASVRASAKRAPAAADGSEANQRSRFRALQRLALKSADGTGVDGDGQPISESTIERFAPVVGAGGVVGAAALALAERLTRSIGPAGAPLRARLLRDAFEGERMPRRRELLAARWAEALAAIGDAVGAIAALDRAITEIPSSRSWSLRQTRADLLRKLGRDRELTRALGADAELASGPARLALLAEHANLLDRLGEPDAALEVRLGALKDAPGELALLAPARARLEAVGWLDRSLELATAAIPYVRDRAARASLLRDVATLAEAASGDRERAASAWLKVIALEPSDRAACEAAERLLRDAGDRSLLGELIAWSAARQADPEARVGLLWRLAEFRRLDQQAPLAALTLYREIVESGHAASDALDFPNNDWRRRDNALAVHTARALAAPTNAARAQAIADRAGLLMNTFRWDDADRDLGRALEIDPSVGDVIGALERLHEQRGDWRGLRDRLSARVDGASAAAAGQLWFGIARAHERLQETAAARAAYERATAAAPGFRPAVTALRQLGVARRDWPEVARLLQTEIELVPAPLARVGLLVELGVLYADRLGRAARAVEVIDEALGFEPTNPAALDAMYRVALGAGAWEKAAQALEAMLGSGINVDDAAKRYFRIGRAAEDAGQSDRALGLYSRSYARNPAYRPTLERLSEICFERQQWDNAWKATEHLIDRHGNDLEPALRAELALRSALADLHVAQRFAALQRLAESFAGSTPPPAGLRDVAESWASMRFDPRLLAHVEGDRRARALARLGQVLSLTEAAPTGSTQAAARSAARETLAALAVVDRRWADAVALLDGCGGDEALTAGRRCLYLVTAGDVLMHEEGDTTEAALRYQRARALNPAEPRLARAGIAQIHVATDAPPADGHNPA